MSDKTYTQVLREKRANERVAPMLRTRPPSPEEIAAAKAKLDEPPTFIVKPVRRYCMQCGERIFPEHWIHQDASVPFCPPDERYRDGNGCGEHIVRFDTETGERLDGYKVPLVDRLQEALVARTTPRHANLMQHGQDLCGNRQVPKSKASR